MKNRLKSKVVWIAVLSQIMLIVTMFLPQIANEFKIIATVIIEVATLFGVLNNPTDKENF